MWYVLKCNIDDGDFGISTGRCKSIKKKNYFVYENFHNE